MSILNRPKSIFLTLRKKAKTFSDDLNPFSWIALFNFCFIITLYWCNFFQPKMKLETFCFAKLCQFLLLKWTWTILKNKEFSHTIGLRPYSILQFQRPQSRWISKPISWKGLGPFQKFVFAKINNIDNEPKLRSNKFSVTIQVFWWNSQF